MKVDIREYSAEPINRHGPDTMMLVAFETDGDRVTVDAMMAPFLQVVLEGLSALADGDPIVFELDAGELRFEPDDGEIEIRSTEDRSFEGGPIRADLRGVAKGCIDLAETFHRQLSESEYEADSYLQTLDERIADAERWYRAEFE